MEIRGYSKLNKLTLTNKKKIQPYNLNITNLWCESDAGNYPTTDLHTPPRGLHLRLE